MARMGNFGPVVFETSSSKVKNWEKISETYRARFAVHEVVDGAPVRQYLGEALPEVSITIKFNRAFCDPEAEITELKNMVNGKAYPLVIGEDVIGEFVLEEAGIARERSTDKGKILLAEVDLKLGAV